MTRKEFDVWLSRINRAKSLQERMHSMWKTSIDLYNCSFFGSNFSSLEPDRVDVNFARWYIDNIIPLVYFRDPYIFIHPRSDKYSTFADTMEKMINVYWRRLEMKQQFKRIILSACIMPPGWIKVGYTAKIGQDIQKLDEIKNKSLIQSIKDTISGTFKKEKKEPTPEELGVLNEYIEQESIYASYLTGWNVLMPEGYQHFQDFPYLIEIEPLPRVDFQAHPLYKNKTSITTIQYIKQPEAGGVNLRRPTYNSLGSSSGGVNDDETEVIKLYHIWDRRSNKRFTMSDDDVHFMGDWSYDVHGFPYEPLAFDETISTTEQANPYPTNLLLPILPQIIEQSNARTQMARWRKGSSAIIIASPLATEEEMRQVEETEGVQIIRANPQLFQMAQSPNLPADVFNVDEKIKEDLQMGTNMGQLMFQAQSGQRTATQAGIAQSGLQLKSSARVDVVEDFTVKVARKLCAIMWQFYDKDKVKEVLGEDITEDMWLTVPDDPEERKQIINNELQLKIDAGSAAPPKDETVDRKQLLDLTSIVMNIAPERINKGEFVKQLLKKFKFSKELDKVVISSDDEETQKAQQENQLMTQGHPQVAGPNESHLVHLGVHQQAKGNPIVDEHILEHGKFLGITPENKGGGEGGGPQSGDIRGPMQSTNPEMVRQGIPNEGNISAGARQLGAGTRGKAI